MITAHRWRYIKVPASDQKSLSLILETLSTFWFANGLDASGQPDFSIALEEVFSNVAKYSSSIAEDITFELTLSLDADVLSMVAADSGPYFNPLSVAQPDLDADLEAIEPGGLGIFLIIQLMDQVSYLRENSKNILTMSMAIPVTPRDRALPRRLARKKFLNTDLEMNENIYQLHERIANLESQLQESQERYRQVTDTINEVFWMTDPGKSKVLFISAGYERIWGRPCESLIKNPNSFLESIHPDDLGTVLAALPGQVEGTYDVEFRIERPDGGLRWIHDKGFALKNTLGEVYRVVGVAQDITERKLSAERLLQKNLELEAARAQITSELDLARAMQVAILPARLPPRPGCDGAARMLAATAMGGDFYDFIELPGGRIGLVIADVSGKGVPAAFFMAVARTNLNALAGTSSGPGECLQRTNEVLLSQNPMELFVSVFYAVFDPATGELTYANGGHNPPLLRRANGDIEILSAASETVMGIFEIDFGERVEHLSPGDCLVLYTDGVTEAFDKGGQMYDEHRLLEQVRLHGGGGAQALLAAIFDSVIEFAGSAVQSDDITLAVLKWRPEGQVG